MKTRYTVELIDENASATYTVHLARKHEAMRVYREYAALLNRGALHGTVEVALYRDGDELLATTADPALGCEQGQ
jgi:hypothetical protein